MHINFKFTDLLPSGRGLIRALFRPSLGAVLPAIALAGCLCDNPSARHGGTRSDQFSVTLEEQVADSTFRLVILKIEARAAEMLQLRGEGGSARPAVALSRAETGSNREGRVVLAGMLVANEPLQAGSRYQAYQALESRGARATQRGLYELGPSSTLETDFAVTITNGTFPLDRPLLIGTCHGQPIVLRVGRWD
jgi:hypothetical protein